MVKKHDNKTKLLTYLNVIVVIIYIGFLSSPLSGIFSAGGRADARFLTGRLPLFLGRDEVVDLHVRLVDRLFLQPFLFLALTVLVALLSALSFALLLIRILVIDSIIKVLVVKLLIISVQFAYSRMESDHHIFVFHEARRHLDNLIRSLVARLRIKRTEDDTTRRIILHQTVLMRLQTAFGELCVQVVGSTRGLMCRQLTRLILALDCAQLELLLLFFEVFKFLLLQDVCELFPDEFQFLLVEDVYVIIDIIVEPWMNQHLLGRGSQLRHLLKHHFHDFNGLLANSVLVLDFLV